MAEGIARSLAPQGVKISSAGSSPTSVHPQAIRVLMEIGIDISGHRSKRLDSIGTGSVDAVITLCAEEVCPVFPGKTHRIHWGLSDPAGVAGSEENRLEAFRSVRDELLRRLEVLFGQGEEKGKGSIGMEEEVDKELQLLQAGMKVDRQLERLEDVKTLTEIIHYYREKRARSSKIALAIVKFVKEG
jgi:arsenate reductase